MRQLTALDAQFLFLGAGEPRYQAELTELAERAPGRIACARCSVASPIMISPAP